MDVQEGLALTDAIEFREVDSDRWGDLERLFESRGGPKYCWRMVVGRHAARRVPRRPRRQEGCVAAARPRGRAHRHTGLY